MKSKKPVLGLAVVLALTGGLLGLKPAFASTGGVLTISDPVVLETTGDSTTISFMITLTGRNNGIDVSVFFETSDTAGSATPIPPLDCIPACPGDYYGDGFVVTFPPESVTVPANITVAGDWNVETDETIVATIRNATGFATIGDGTGVGTIWDDDGNDLTLTTSDLLPPYFQPIDNDTPLAIGDRFALDLKVANHGHVWTDQVIVRVTVPPSVEVDIPVTVPAGSCKAMAERVVDCNVGSIAPGSYRTTRLAWLYARELEDAVITATAKDPSLGDPFTENNTMSSVTRIVSQSATLKIEPLSPSGERGSDCQKAMDRKYLVKGCAFVMGWYITNTGPTNAVGWTAGLRSQGGFVNVNPSLYAFYNSNLPHSGPQCANWVCTGTDTLAVGERVLIAFGGTASIPSYLQPHDWWSAGGTVFAKTPINSTKETTLNMTVPVVPDEIDLGVQITQQASTVRPGQDNTYNIAVSSYGPREGTGIAVVTLPEGVVFRSANSSLCSETSHGIVSCNVTYEPTIFSQGLINIPTRFAIRVTVYAPNVATLTGTPKQTIAVSTAQPSHPDTVTSNNRATIDTNVALT